MTFLGLTMPVLLIIVLLGFVLRPVLVKRTLTELLLFSMLLVLIGGLLLIDPNIERSNGYTIFLYGLIECGFYIGLMSFLLK